MAGYRMRFCASCREYTLRDACPHCGGKAAANAPAKYSPEDRYGAYRRRLKRMGPGKPA